MVFSDGCWGYRVSCLVQEVATQGHYISVVAQKKDQSRQELFPAEGSFSLTWRKMSPHILFTAAKTSCLIATLADSNANKQWMNVKKRKPNNYVAAVWFSATGCDQILHTGPLTERQMLSVNAADLRLGLYLFCEAAQCHLYFNPLSADEGQATLNSPSAVMVHCVQTFFCNVTQQTATCMSFCSEPDRSVWVAPFHLGHNKGTFGFTINVAFKFKAAILRKMNF